MAMPDDRQTSTSENIFACKPISFFSKNQGCIADIKDVLGRGHTLFSKTIRIAYLKYYHINYHINVQITIMFSWSDSANPFEKPCFHILSDSGRVSLQSCFQKFPYSASII